MKNGLTFAKAFCCNVNFRIESCWWLRSATVLSPCHLRPPAVITSLYYCYSFVQKYLYLNSLHNYQAYCVHVSTFDTRGGCSFNYFDHDLYSKVAWRDNIRYFVADFRLSSTFERYPHLTQLPGLRHTTHTKFFKYCCLKNYWFTYPLILAFSGRI